MDAERLVADVNARSGLELRLVGVADQGAVSGAVFVQSRDGHPAVLTVSSSSVAQLRTVGEILASARAGGARVPRYERIVPLTRDTSVVVQERLLGTPPSTVDARTIDAIVEANESFAGILRGRPDVPAPELYLSESGPGYCLHETLAHHDERSRRLLGWIREVGRTAPRTLVGDDLVHWDLLPNNVLFDNEGNLVGVVDWDGIARGDRRFALIKLRFNLHRAAILPSREDPAISTDAIVRLDDHLRTLLEPEDFRRYWAHWSLSMVDWAIRHESSDISDAYLELATSRLD